MELLSEREIIIAILSTGPVGLGDVINYTDSTPNKHNSSSFCLWYVSPLWQSNDVNNTKYTLLDESNKWTVVSRQRFTSININVEKIQTTIILESSATETVELLVYHSAINVLSLICFFFSSVTHQAQMIFTPSRVTCSMANEND
ncbi:unnamed protein product [Rotaria sp. Silwood2]|nr:unnamed protein product [Rotaria sp. Silwood2]CAF3117233.1 unnamed protein product [Rotaria sp. Silwood2]CAF4501845.1 unnamed protein product [Rotaria sp. Silwood2]